MKKLYKYLVTLGLAIAFLSACGLPPAENKPKLSPSPTPYQVEPVKVEKPANVSFSTYSSEWPVGWQWIDPDEKYAPTPHDVKSGVLRVRIPTGKDLAGDKRSAPRYLKAITGDFQIETRVKFLPKENYQGAGLLIYRDENNYMRFERAYGGVGGGGEGIRIDVRRQDEYKPLVTPDDIQTDAGQVDLKVVRRGKLFIAYWRIDEESEWREAGEFESDYADTVLAGLITCNTAREVTAEFAYIRLLPAN
jgi:regulation of enolase protein 1 (concanavalin A-like superfamily)